MATNKIDYDVLESTSTTYQKGAEAISNVLTSLNSTNKTLAEGWQNKTAEAFLNEFETVHKKALESAIKAITDISTYIKKYSENEKQRDIDGANSIGR